MSKNIYLDVCTFCRPFGDQCQIRIRIETDAYFLILKAIEQGTYQSVISPVHFAEIEAIEDIQERVEILALLSRIKTKVTCKLGKIRERADALIALNFGIADAAHVAFAEATSEAFISCDDKLLKKCRKRHITVPAFTPIEFALQEGLK